MIELGRMMASSLNVTEKVNRSYNHEFINKTEGSRSVEGMA
jgi:hypothetical protein